MCQNEVLCGNGLSRGQLLPPLDVFHVFKINFFMCWRDQASVLYVALLFQLRLFINALSHNMKI